VQGIKVILENNTKLNKHNKQKMDPMIRERLLEIAKDGVCRNANSIEGGAFVGGGRHKKRMRKGGAMKKRAKHHKKSHGGKVSAYNRFVKAHFDKIYKHKSGSHAAKFKATGKEIGRLWRSSGHRGKKHRKGGNYY
jgi:hypothetical protein